MHIEKGWRKYREKDNDMCILFELIEGQLTSGCVIDWARDILKYTQ